MKNFLRRKFKQWLIDILRNDTETRKTLISAVEYEKQRKSPSPPKYREFMDLGAARWN